MKLLWTLLIAVSLFWISEDGVAQRRRPPMEREQQRPERLEQWKKMKLVELLDLNEDEAVRFFAKQNSHEDKQRELMGLRKEAVDDLEYMLRQKDEKKDLQKTLDKILEIDQNMFAERRRYHDELRKSLTPEQFGKFLVFERNFGQELRNAMKEMQRERRFRERD
ncbi:MAG: hypothetical protein HY707_08625 [Ignavibacteriae bacterium]|nr:hypothetical protein [Ignavibacteriota bacterium]